ncbi:MAG: hypothetical protein ACI8PZ_005702 [Myxococcota bacterium]|jgi:hypothetical protein
MIGWLLLALLGCVESADHLKGFEDTAAVDTTPPTTTGVGTPPTTTTPPVEDCANGIDDDGDGRPDCFDTECELICDADSDGEDAIAYGGEDCDDTNPDVNPDALERCNTIDDDCDGLIDDDDPDLPPSDKDNWFPDVDLDGYGDGSFDPRNRCAGPAGYVANNFDCDDTTAAIGPDQPEICNPIEPLDDDCDGLIDDDDPDVTPDSYLDWYADRDGDGFGSSEGDVVRACSRPDDAAFTDDDCDDTDPTIGPPSVWMPDGDGDGFGAGLPVDPTPTCEPPADALGPDWRGMDCDDGAPLVYPGAPEVCEDGIDQDCDGGDLPCITYVGSFLVDDGPGWMTSPPTLSCAEACAELFGGTADTYKCSIDASLDPETITRTAWVSEYGSADHCMSGGDPLGDTEKNCALYDTSGCQSAYIQDNCYDGSENHCWRGGD